MINKETYKNKKAAYFTLGCKLNFAETSAFGSLLKDLGITPIKEGEQADICLVNTCTVTEVADKKCRQAIRKLVKEHPNAFVVVTGCYAQVDPAVIGHIDGVDLVLGSEQKASFLNYLGDLSKNEHTVVATSEMKNIHSFAAACDCGDRTRYFLKVQDGCDYFCTYCLIPYSRGRSRNAPIADLVHQVEEAVTKGAKEIVLTGVNTGDFGRTTNETFIDLLRALDEVKGVERYRISSIEPNLLTEEIIRFVAQSKHFMSHFHVPLQSGSDEVLQLMHRRYTTAFFAEKIAQIKHYLPDAFIGVDVIVGTNGETATHFEEAQQFIQTLDISQLHVFSYSERPGTQALKITPKVDPHVKHARSQCLLEISEEKRIAFYAAHKGLTMEVLVEGAKENSSIHHGHTYNYIRVEIEDENVVENTIHTVLLSDFNSDKSALMGTVVTASPTIEPKNRI